MKPFWFLTACIAILFMFAVIMPNAFAKWEEIPEHGTTIDFGGSRGSHATSLDGTAIHAMQYLWLGVDGSLTSNENNGETIKEGYLTGRIQGSYLFDPIDISVQGLLEADKEVGDDPTVNLGLYLRKVWEIDKLELALGAGTISTVYSLKDDTKTDIVRLDNITPDPLGVLGIEYTYSENIDLHIKGTARPIFNDQGFADLYWNAMLGVDVILSDKLTLKLQSILEKDEVEIDTSNSIVLSINLN